MLLTRSSRAADGSLTADCMEIRQCKRTLENLKVLSKHLQQCERCRAESDKVLSLFYVEFCLYKGAGLRFGHAKHVSGWARRFKTDSELLRRFFSCTADPQVLAQWGHLLTPRDLVDAFYKCTRWWEDGDRHSSVGVMAATIGTSARSTREIWLMHFGQACQERQGQEHVMMLNHLCRQYEEDARRLLMRLNGPDMLDELQVACIMAQ